MTEPLWTSSDWTFEKIQQVYDACEQVALNELRLNVYQNSIELISSEQMLDAYTSVGMPIYYQHWSFGKHFVQEQRNYQKGRSGLAYELVINANPVVNYLMEDNSMTMQALVIAHAAFGHNHFFKNNYLFKQWTDASSIIDYLIFAKDYVNAQEIKHGQRAVENWLDSCHALMDYGVNRYKRPSKLSMEKEKQRQKERADYLQTQVSELYRILLDPKIKDTETVRFPKQPEENLLYFFEKYSPDIEDWQRELLRIVRKIAQYFYPQGQCVTGNHLVCTSEGLLRFDELIQKEGYHTNQNIQLLTHGNKFTPISHTYKRKADVIKITTKLGKRFTGTPEHPLTVLRNGQELLVRLDELTKDDYLVTNLDYDIFSKTSQSLSYTVNDSPLICKLCGLKSNFIGSHISQIHNLSPLEYEKKFNSPISNEISRINKSTNKIIKIPTELTTNLAALIPFFSYIGPLSYNSNFVFSSNQPKLVKIFQELLNDVFGLDIPVSIDKFHRQSINFSSYTLKKFLSENFDDLYHKSIPLKIRLSPNLVIREYIKSFIDLFSVNRHSIGQFKLCGYNSHREFFEQLQTVLFGFGIGSRIQVSTRQTLEGMCRLLGLPEDTNRRTIVDIQSFQIVPDFFEKFSTVIGSRLDLEVTKSTNKYHVIPNGMNLLNETRRKLIDARAKYSAKNREILKTKSYKIKKSNGVLVKQNFIPSTIIPEINAQELTYGHITKNCDKFQNLAQCYDIPEATILLNLIKNSHGKFYDKIENIQYENEEQYVYDVTVPENHLFWLDGVISHNTKVMNEGFASLTHYEIMNILHDKGLTTDGAHLEFLSSHVNVLYQPTYDSPHYSGLNPYAFGFAMLRDIQRMCENPTKEDLQWFPQVNGANSQDLILEAVENFRDESFIRQWLSPKVIRDLKLFALNDDRNDKEKYLVTAIHNERGYEELRETLADQYLRAAMVPHLEVVNVDRKTRCLYIQYNEHKGRKLGNVYKMLPHIEKLWGGYPVVIKDQNGNELGRTQAGL